MPSMPDQSLPFGSCVPPDTPHSVIFSIPAWQDHVKIVQGKSDSHLMKTTYPRFAFHPFVRQLNEVVLNTLNAASGGATVECFLFPSLKTVQAFRSFMHIEHPSTYAEDAEIHCVSQVAHAPPSYRLFAMLIDSEQRRTAMRFWIFSGSGISSRFAEHCLQRRRGFPDLTLGLPMHTGHDYAAYYQTHAPLKSVSKAKETIRARFAGITAEGTNIRGVPRLCCDDVYLYPTGMNAVWNARQLLRAVLGDAVLPESTKTAHINVLYIDSYKMPDATRPGYHFFRDEDFDDLERLLEHGTVNDPAVLAIFTDFPGNPNLRSVDLPRLRTIADRYHIPIIIDETTGCYLNVSVLPYADIIVASLTKVFSGFANVLGGALLINPASEFYRRFQSHLGATYEDNYFDSDALVMELNSRGIEERLSQMNRNAEALADWLYSRSRMGGAEESVLDEVLYPKYVTRENYERCMRNIDDSSATRKDSFQVGYSMLLSVTFTSLDAARTFYEGVKCYRGTTLGTVVTLASAFTALAVPPEKAKWLVEHDLKEALVRFSIGVEDTACIVDSVDAALKSAQECGTPSRLRSTRLQ